MFRVCTSTQSISQHACNGYFVHLQLNRKSSDCNDLHASYMHLPIDMAWNVAFACRAWVNIYHLCQVTLVLAEC